VISEEEAIEEEEEAPPVRTKGASARVEARQVETRNVIDKQSPTKFNVQASSSARVSVQPPTATFLRLPGPSQISPLPNAEVAIFASSKGSHGNHAGNALRRFQW